MFDDRSDVLEKTIKVTVPSLPKENGLPVKINVILLRFPQAKLFLAKIIVLDFTGVFRRDGVPSRVTSEKAETFVTESPDNKGILKGGKVFTQILLCRQNSSSSRS